MFKQTQFARLKAGERELKMTKKELAKYESPNSLKKLLWENLKGKKFRLDCGHHVTIGSNLGQDIMIHNGQKKLIVECSFCSY